MNIFQEILGEHIDEINIVNGILRDTFEMELREKIAKLNTALKNEITHRAILAGGRGLHTVITFKKKEYFLQYSEQTFERDLNASRFYMYKPNTYNFKTQLKKSAFGNWEYAKEHII